MMLTLEYIDSLASLSKLSFSEDEKTKLKEYMENLIEYVGMLDEVSEE